MPRALGLIRVSKEREGMTSPDVQRHAIEEYARTTGHRVTEWVEGIDESGSRARSAWWPKLDESLTRLEAGEFDAIIVWKFSRTSRNRLKWAVALDRADKLGGALLSATEPIDTTTSHGRLARGMVGEFNAYQAELIGDTWREAHARRFREGKPINGKPRFGYAYDTETKSFHPDPINGPILAETYRRYIAGESIYSLTQWLNDGPAVPSPGYSAKASQEWGAYTVRRILNSGFAAGYISYRGQERKGIHEPLITDEEWDAYQVARDSRRSKPRTERSTYSFSGMVWCACGSKMHGQMMGTPLAKRYRCAAAITARRHSGGNVSESVVDAAVYAFLVKHSKRLREETARQLKLKPAALPDRRTAILKKLAEVDARQERLAESMIDDRIPLATYERIRDKLTAEAQTLNAELKKHTVRSAAPRRIDPEILARWGDIEPHEKRELVKTIVRRIDVTPGRPIGVVNVTPWD